MPSLKHNPRISEITLKRITRFSYLLGMVLLLGPLSMVFSSAIKFGQDWRTADRSSTGIAPSPQETREAVIQVYTARAFNWRALFAVHTWIATKPENAESYTVHHVLGWNKWYQRPVVVSEMDLPDRSWYGQQPKIIRDIRGAEAAALIGPITEAIKSYPYQYEYTVWPGPNSNTFVAHIGRKVPQLKLDLPPTAIGKDFISDGLFFSRTPSGRGFQFSFFGLLGFLISPEEGLEINILGLGFGIDPLGMNLRLPGVGLVPE